MGEGLCHSSLVIAERDHTLDIYKPRTPKMSVALIIIWGSNYPKPESSLCCWLSLQSQTTSFTFIFKLFIEKSRTTVGTCSRYHSKDELDHSWWLGKSLNDPWHLNWSKLKTACVPGVSEFRFIGECSSTKLMAGLKSEAKRAKPRRNLMTWLCGKVWSLFHWEGLWSHKWPVLCQAASVFQRHAC